MHRHSVHPKKHPTRETVYFPRVCLVDEPYPRVRDGRIFVRTLLWTPQSYAHCTLSGQTTDAAPYVTWHALHRIPRLHY
jgi:hypothetical protein